MADITPSGNPLDDATAAWLAYEVNKINRVDDPKEVPSPVPSDSRTKYTAKTANTDKNFQARIIAWIHGEEVGGTASLPILMRDGISVGNAMQIRSGTGTPEGVVTAGVSSLWGRTDGGAGTTLYIKESGAGNTGWVTVATADHGALTGLDDPADHTWASLVDGSRAFTGTVAGVTPVAAADLATKSYVDNLVQLIEWQDSVIDRDLTGPPGAPTTGDRYIVAATATGDWTGQEDNIAEWNGSSWDFTTPSLGMIVAIDDESGQVVRWNGATWEDFELSLTLDHGALTGLADPSDHTWAALVDGTRDITGDQVFAQSIAVDGAAVADGVVAGDAIVAGAGTGSTGITLHTSTAGIGGLFWTDDAGTTKRAAIEYQQSTFSFTFRANGAGEMYLTPVALAPFVTGGLNLGATNLWWGTAFTNTLYVNQFEAADAVTGATDVGIGDGSAAAGVTIFTSATTAGKVSITDTAGTEVGAWGYNNNSPEMFFIIEGTQEGTWTSSALTIANNLILSDNSAQLTVGGGGSSADAFWQKDDLATFEHHYRTDSGSGLNSHWIEHWEATTQDMVLKRRNADGTANGDVRTYDWTTGRATYGYEVFVSGALSVAGGDPADAEAAQDDLVIGDFSSSRGMQIQASSAGNATYGVSDNNLANEWTAALQYRFTDQLWRIYVEKTGVTDIDSSGNIITDGAFVGTGAALADAPGWAADLVLGTTAGATGLTLVSGTTSDGHILFTDGGAADVGRITYDHNNTQFEFWLEGTLRVVMNSGGSMALTTANISDALGSADDLVLGSTSSGDHGITILGTTTGNGSIEFQDNTTPTRVGAIDYDHNNDTFSFYVAGSIEADMDASGFDAKIIHPVEARWNSNVATLEYIPLSGTTTSTDIGAVACTLIAPFDGEVEDIEVVADTNGVGATPGSTVIGVHINHNATAAETDTINMSANLTKYTFSYTASSAFTKGDRLTFSWDPTNGDTNFVWLTIKLRNDTTT